MYADYIYGDPDLPQRFWDKVEKTDTCWLWTAALHVSGYGKFGISQRIYYAHRVAFAALVGAIAEGMQVDHKCRVRRCVNPDHLQAVTPKLNNQNRSGATAHSTTGVRGVSWHRRFKRWQVSVGREGRAIFGGYFDDLASAEAAAIALRNKWQTNNLADRTAS